MCETCHNGYLQAKHKREKMILFKSQAIGVKKGINIQVTEEELEKFPECFTKPSTERNEGLASSEFISHAGLLRKEYNKDDSITLKISVEQILTPF